MPLYRSILVPVALGDGQEGRFAAAIEVAHALADPGARIILLHVVKDVPGHVAAYLPGDCAARARRAVTDAMEAMAARTNGAEGVVISGHSARTILVYAAKQGCDLIVVASHRPGFQDLLIGSTAAQVVRHAQCSVHVLR